MKKAWPQPLLEPEAFPHPVAQLELVETHISWVILTGDYAYKIKKPVDLSFLDFSTLEKRAHFCERELQLNRRFAPKLYLERVAITATGAGKYRVGGTQSGTVVDYAVKMRQFDNGALLDNLAKRHLLDSTLLRSVARELARLHNTLPSYATNGKTGTPAAFAEAIAQNFNQIADYSLPKSMVARLDTLRQWQSERFEKSYSLMMQRLEAGRVKDCHGDCHLGNIIVLDDKVTFFDCIEFNDDFRIMDTIAETAFLSMDLQARDWPQQSQGFINDYLEYRDDFAGLPLLDLFRSHFALVRAKVNLLRESPQQGVVPRGKIGKEFTRYVNLAETFTRSGAPFLALMYGLSGSGKSYVAATVAAATGAIRVRSDVERKRLFQLKPEESGTGKDDLYSADASRRTFTRLLELAKTIVASGFPCIVDATFIRRATREPFIRWCGEHNIPLTIMACAARESTIHQRLERRSQEKNDASEADLAIYQQQKRHLEPLTQEEKKLSLTIDTEDSHSIKEAVRQMSDARWRAENRSSDRGVANVENAKE